MRALVLLNGDLCLGAWGKTPELTGPWDCIICADGGGRHALQLGLHPDLLLGDFDSLETSEQEAISARFVHSYPTAKDETDGELAVTEALRRGAAEVVIAGAFGGRIDHVLGNIGLLRMLHRHGAHGVATDGRQCVWLATPADCPFLIAGAAGELLSILPLTTTVSGVTLTGTRWPLANATLDIGESRTISNELIDPYASVTVAEGELLVIKHHRRIT
jgi:thiamine pyrophosphokinase